MTTLENKQVTAPWWMRDNFAAAHDGAAEDDGYVMTYIHDKTTGTSSFVILAGQDIAGPPVAVVQLPQRVPHGFHGSWVPTH